MAPQMLWCSEIQRSNYPSVNIKTVLLSLAALSPMGCGAQKDVLQALRLLQATLIG
jgi:hypothetical protein